MGKGTPEGNLSTVKTRTEGGGGEENTPCANCDGAGNPQVI